MVINRVGDFGLIFGILFIFFFCKTVDYNAFLYLIPYLDIYQSSINTPYIIDLIAFLLLVGSIGKSAQLGLHAWLPDAMEGPTPVSALIHAATMVTAGVFLLIRCSILFEYASTVLLIIMVIGGITAFFASTIGLVQNDLKRVIAYSTCSQLGYMVFSCGMSNYAISLFHLVNHAFFKALLFLSAGAIIHSLNDEQDMRKMGGLQKLLPFIYTSILIGSLALVGFPFLTGFYSKDIILESIFGMYKNFTFFIYLLGILAAMGTTFYSLRLIYLVFLTPNNSFRVTIKNIHEPSKYIFIVLLILSIFSLFNGYIFYDLFLGLGTFF